MSSRGEGKREGGTGSKPDMLTASISSQKNDRPSCKGEGVPSEVSKTPVYLCCAHPLVWNRRAHWLGVTYSVPAEVPG